MWVVLVLKNFIMKNRLAIGYWLLVIGYWLFKIVYFLLLIYNL